MGRILKLLGIVLGAVVALLAAVVLGVVFLIDPNDYKDEITAAVARATGRELTLAGDLELAVFPTLRIALGEAELSNAQGFGDQPFARIGNAELVLRLLPLLSRRIEIDAARLTGLELNLARNAQGRDNWQDLAGAADATAEPAPAPEDEGGASLALDIGEIDVADARVTWNDASTGSQWVLDDFNLDASRFGPGAAFPLSMAFRLSGADVNVAVDVETRATLSLAENDYRLERLTARIEGSGPSWPGGSGVAQLALGELHANLGSEALDLNGMQLDFLGLRVTGNLTGRQLMSNLSLAGAVDIAEFNPSELLRVFDAAIETADSNVLRRASAKANFAYDSNQIGLRDMQLVLDDSTLTGRVGLEGEALRYNLAVDAINVDRYLPPASEGGSADEGSIDEVDLPLEALRTLNASGDLSFGQVQFIGLTLTEAAFSLTARNGRLDLKPRAALYGGQYSGDVRIEVQGNAARLTLVQQVQNVDMLPLGRDLLEAEDVSGRGNVSLNLTATGSNVGQMRRDLDGDVSFIVRDGAWEGFDAWYELRRLRAVADGNAAPERPAGARRTPFSSVSASGVVNDAILTNRDLNAALGFMTIGGSGTVNLLTDALDFNLTAQFVDGPMLQSDPAMASLAGASLPLTVGGTLDAPSIRPNFGAVVRQRAREEVTERVEEERGEVQERVEEQREEVRERVRDRLRGLLDR